MPMAYLQDISESCTGIWGLSHLFWVAGLLGCWVDGSFSCVCTQDVTVLGRGQGRQGRSLGRYKSGLLVCQQWVCECVKKTTN